MSSPSHSQNAQGDLHPASPEARSKIVLGVIGGSGLYDLDGLARSQRVTLDTPFGTPSSDFVVGELERAEGPPIACVFVARHGAGHRLAPHEINARANLWGLKSLGVTHVISVSAVGSLQEELAPGEFVLVDQFIDRTRQRASSFFGQGIVGHVQFGEPTCAQLRARLAAAVRATTPKGSPARLHEGGTCVVMEGPAFSTRAESEMYRSFGGSVIGMTALPEAKLAREAEMAYAMLAMVTDYDCWRHEEEEVSVEQVVAVMRDNVSRAKAALVSLAAQLPVACADLPYPRACENAVMSDVSALTPEQAQRIDLIIGHQLAHSESKS